MKKLDPIARDYIIARLESAWEQAPDIIAFAAHCVISWRCWVSDASYHASRSKISVVQLHR